MECYNCHQTTKDCVDGIRRRLHTNNRVPCMANECFVLKYETNRPGVTVKAVQRGCHDIPHADLLKTISDTIRETDFSLCNTTLCNTAMNSSPSFNIFTLYALYLVYNIVSL
ncbi:hypothetical protein NQ318_022436 [Aromia moschata]|uniref:Protein quiver n=1 Tax=Aromia moschata TaxID=1265417 RepID=A0AAV8Z594_9CUCU|nr:hypothetical protein NQ318_022436 [Aromia moschata]